jgi:hypothetical protein
MRKLPTEEVTEPMNLRVKKSVKIEFYNFCLSEGRNPAKQFEIIWKAFKVGAISGQEFPKPSTSRKQGVIRFEGRVGRTEIERKAEEGNQGK